MKLSTLAALVWLTLLPSTAFATELNLKTLTGLPALTPGSGTYSVTKDGVTVTFTALNNGSTSSSTDLTWQPGDGFGVDTSTDSNGTQANDRTAEGDVLTTSDEINAKESIKVTFSKEVLIQSIAITDIYDQQSVKGYWFLWPTETGAWKVTGPSGNDAGTFEGIAIRDGANNGEIKVNINELATVLSVYSTNDSSEANYKGFSLAGITFTTKAVPELSGQGIGAAAFLLFGAAQLLSARRRRLVATA